MARLTISDLGNDLIEALEQLAQKRGQSSEALVRDLIEREVDLDRRWARFRNLSTDVVRGWRRERALRHHGREE